MTLRTNDELQLMREAGQRLATVLDTLERDVRAGMTTAALDHRALELIRKAGGEPAFLGYAPYGAQRPYPATICASLNEGIVHGLPQRTPLKDGDVLKIDIGLTYRGWYADMARTYVIGEAAPRIHELVAVTKQALDLGIAAAVPGAHVGDIGYAVSSHVRKHRFAVVEGLGGHGIGRALHEDPFIANTGKQGKGTKLVPGMVIAIEPMVATGSKLIEQLDDDSFVTYDRSIAAHFEHTVAITENGPEILTLASGRV